MDEWNLQMNEKPTNGLAIWNAVADDNGIVL